MNPSSAQAAVIVDELIANGVTDAVLAPGSRSAPLAFALHSADSAGRIRLHVRIDERGAGFLALGLAKGSGRPAAVVTTSGTAVANLHPAVLESHHGGVPLLVLSADRPHHLRGVGANQVIDQLTVFGSGVLCFQHEFAIATIDVDQSGYWRGQVSRAVAGAVGAFTSGRPGPAHLNIPFDVPLVPDGAGSAGGASGAGDLAGTANRRHPWTEIAMQHADGYAAAVSAVPGPLPGEKCLVIADLTHPLAAAFAAAGYLVISEAGGLAGAHVLGAAMHLLADADFVARNKPDRVIVLGRPTLFRAVTSLLATRQIMVDVVDHAVGFADLAGTVRQVNPTLPGIFGVPLSEAASVTSAASSSAASSSAADSSGVSSLASNAWATAWRAADARASAAVDSLVDGADPNCSATVARAMARALPHTATLFLGSSQPPRDIARFAGVRDGVRMLANRGVAGIDGSVSTAIGIALSTNTESAYVASTGAESAYAASTGPQAAYALMGDLTFLHDVTALAIGPHEPRPDLTIVVANNDGGGIFATLEQGDPRHASAFERIFGTPTGAQIAQLAEAFGAEHVLATTLDELASEVAARPDGLRIVEVPVNRNDLRSFDARVAEAVHQAIHDPG